MTIRAIQRSLIFAAALLTVAGSTSDLLSWSDEPLAGKVAEVEDAEEDEREVEVIRVSQIDFDLIDPVAHHAEHAAAVDAPVTIGQHHERGPPSRN